MITINNIPLRETALNIILDVQRELTNGKLKDVIDGSEDIRVTCPFHNDGHEKTASCFVRKEDFVFHCFGCGEKGGVVKFVAGCLDISYKAAEEWLINRYGDQSGNSEILSLEPIVLNSYTPDNDVIDESILSTFESYHPYMKKRKLSDDVIEKFEVKYDPKDESLVFPVRNELGQLIGLTRRKVNFKRFELWKFRNKPVYLLYKILKNNIRHVVVCESQINALYLWSCGIPAIALFGTGTDYQYSLLKKSCILYYTLCFDGDEAGRKGAKKFKKAFKDVFVDEVVMPEGKDINDYDKSTILELFPEFSLQEANDNV